MFAAQLQGAIEHAPFTDLNDLSRKIWQAHAANILDDETAQRLAETIHERRKGGYRDIGHPSNFKPVAFPRARPQRSPDKIRSIERRRRLAASGPLPPALACKFTVSELACLRIVGDEIRRHGVCALHIDAIAARAGTCRTTCQNAMREARRLGLLTIEERRRRGQPSLTNLVRIVSAEWLTWLRIGNTGLKKMNSAGTSRKERGFRESKLQVRCHDSGSTVVPAGTTRPIASP